MPVIDTNVLLRHLTQDVQEQSQRAFALLQEVEEGRRTVTLSEGVLVETIQVLSSPRSYGVEREEIREQLLSILGLPRVRMSNKRRYLRALDIYVQYRRLSFVDALCAAYAEGAADHTVVSFDRGFRNVVEIDWEEPWQVTRYA